MNQVKSRLQAEVNALEIKVNKLTKFIRTNKEFKKFRWLMRIAMRIQLRNMNHYLKMIKFRLEFFDKHYKDNSK